MRQRVITAIIAIPIACFLVRRGGIFCALGVALLVFVSWREYKNMLLQKGYHVYYLTGCLPALLLVVAAALGKLTLWGVPLLTITILAIMLEALVNHARGQWAFEMALTSGGVLYIGLLFAHFILLRNITGASYTTGLIGTMSLGEALLWIVMLGTWSSDTFAYIFGCTFGKHKLMPAVSPKKSVEGAVAGFIGCILVIVLLGCYCLSFTIVQVLPLGLLVAIFAPLGDLVESILKRFCAIKDSGNFFPGHGGVLDRCDSLLFAIPLAYYYIEFFLL